MTELAGRKILVTGATGVIGGATVRRLVKEGAEVTAGGRSVQKLELLASETGARPLSFDLTSERSVRDAVAGLELWGVVNCGGWGGEIAAPKKPTSTSSTR
jgi:L-xylulose reductase